MAFAKDGVDLDILLAFALQWSHPDHPPVRVDHSELHAAEVSLNVTFPEDYKAEVLTTGLPWPTLALISGILDRGADLHDISELYLPQQIVDISTGWHEVGMPKTLVAIGSDGGGNQFCFDRRDLHQTAVLSAPVYYWDHEFGTVEQVSTSFPGWIGSYIGEWSRGLSYRDF